MKKQVKLFLKLLVLGAGLTLSFFIKDPSLANSILIMVGLLVIASILMYDL